MRHLGRLNTCILDGSHGLQVIEGDLRSRGREFDSQDRLDILSHYFFCKKLLLVCKKTEN